MLKERFKSLKELKIMAKNAKSLLVVCDWVCVCAVLHNIILLCDHDDIMDCDIPPLDDGNQFNEVPAIIHFIF